MTVAKLEVILEPNGLLVVLMRKQMVFKKIFFIFYLFFHFLVYLFFPFLEFIRCEKWPKTNSKTFPTENWRDHYKLQQATILEDISNIYEELRPVLYDVFKISLYYLYISQNYLS